MYGKVNTAGFTSCDKFHLWNTVHCTHLMIVSIIIHGISIYYKGNFRDGGKESSQGALKIPVFWRTPLETTFLFSFDKTNVIVASFEYHKPEKFRCQNPFFDLCNVQYVYINTKTFAL